MPRKGLFFIGQDSREAPCPTLNSQEASKGTNPTDPFNLLPIELKLEIAKDLTMPDYFNLRFASRSMASLFESPSFWRERFDQNRDCGFLSFMLDGSNELLGGLKGWRQIYHSVKVPAKKGFLGDDYDMFGDLPRGGPAGDEWLVDRYWIWKRKHWLRDMLVAAEIHSPNQGLPPDQYPKQILRQLSWRAIGLLGSCTTACASYCYSGHRPHIFHDVFLPQSVAKVAVWVTESDQFISHSSSIAGIELITTDTETPNVGIGYRNIGKKVTLDIDPSESLRGFEISVNCEYSHNGRAHGKIQAIRVCTGTSNMESEEKKSRWLGSHIEGDSTKRLCTPKTILALRGGFLVG